MPATSRKADREDGEVYCFENFAYTVQKLGHSGKKRKVGYRPSDVDMKKAERLE